jgi:RNA polymerase sigma-70 factor (ECF subfamily)
VFAAALIGRHGYRQDRGSPRQWLLGIAANKVADARRRGRVERRAQQRLGIPTIEWTDGDLERVAALTDDERLIVMLGDLPAEQRDAVQARVVEERAYDEIARISGVSEVTVRKRVSRGLATLRERLSKET